MSVRVSADQLVILCHYVQNIQDVDTAIDFNLILEQRCPSNSSLTVVHSLYHRADHCICPDGYACTGSHCSIGHGTDGYSYTVSGFKSDCVDCRCVWAPRSEGLPRDKGVLWITGTHHKMRSEFMRDLWLIMRRTSSHRFGP